MKIYKATDNSLHELSDQDIVNGGLLLLPAGCVEITESDADAIRAANQPAPQIPQTVTMRQARLALLAVGKLQQVNDAIQNMTGTAGDEARIEWEFSSEVHRNKALVQSLAPTLGMTDAELDQLFINASQL